MSSVATTRPMSANEAPPAQGPSGRALLVLLGAALAIIATSPPPPSLQAYAVGEVMLAGIGPVEREVRIHIAPEAGGARAGTIRLGFQATHGLGDSWTRDVALRLAAGDDQAPPSIGGGYAIPVERCTDGCDLTYRVVVAPATGLPPASVVRFEVDVRLDYDSGWYGPDAGSRLTVDLEGAATGPPAAAWSVVAGLLALLAGMLAGPRVGRALDPARRSWPAIVLLALVLLWLLRGLVAVLGFILDPAVIEQLARMPLSAVAWFDPWSLSLLLFLALGLWHGVRRWPSDGGWSAALAAAATVGLGGLWLVWAETVAPVINPAGLGLMLALPAFLGGIVLGEARVTDARSTADETWAAIGIVAHGILIAGFGFVAVQPFNDPFASSAVGLLALVPAGLLALALRRWLAGGRRWLILFDVLIAATGVLGLWVTTSMAAGLSYGPDRLSLDEVGVLIAVGASLVALATAFHRFSGSAGARRSTIAVVPPTT